jgi:heme O synthase-like polyprenyltransferase
MVTEATARRASAQRRFGAYGALTRPRNFELLLVTTVPAMVVADHRDACHGRIDAARAMRLFGFSNTYLMLLFASMAVDVLLPHH